MSLLSDNINLSSLGFRIVETFIARTQTRGRFYQDWGSTRAGVLPVLDML